MPSEAKKMAFVASGPVGLDCAEELAAVTGSVGATTRTDTSKSERTCQNLLDIFLLLKVIKLGKNLTNGKGSAEYFLDPPPASNSGEILPNISY
jgi:hypothetical protein